jgi:predicted Zn finger-like uncharacterized protein
MYTQCPACHTAFRVTARVLQQAAGRVRCGGCGSAFNALEYLSEELPADNVESPAPRPAGQADVKKKKMLEKLDELTGPETVVIEDTGIEWQVLDNPEAKPGAVQQDSGDTASMRWTIEDVQDLDRDAEALPEIVDEVSAAAGADEADSDAVGNMRFDDNTPLPEDYDDVVTVSPPTPQRRQQDKVVLETAHFDELQFDLALGNAEEWVNLLEEVDSNDATGDAALPLEVEEELAAIHSELTTRPATGKRKAEAPLAADDDEDDADRDVTALAIDVEEDEPVATAATGGASGEHVLSLVGETPSAEPEPRVLAVEDAVEDAGDDDDIAELVLRGALESAAEPESEQEQEQEQLPRHAARGKHSADTKPEESSRKPKYPDHLFDENADNVETIIMEGELVHGSLREQELAAKEAAERLGDAAFLADTYSLNRDTVRGGKRKTDPAAAGVIAAVVVLAVLLAGQVMHNMRQTLSTVGAFNQTVAPIYRLLGQPITPDWDIRGWQFQTTSGGTDETGQLLTIYSTVANRSTQALPYPLVHVSLTDRWEEIVGSRVLEPSEYLAGNADPSKAVAAGDRFTAAISIDSPSAEATGFKLNVCYRVAPGQVRCATEDFRE